MIVVMTSQPLTGFALLGQSQLVVELIPPDDLFYYDQQLQPGQPRPGKLIEAIQHDSDHEC